jgi:adenylate cyclase
LWTGIVQFFARDFAAALETLRELIRLRLSYGSIYEYAAGALAFLGRPDEARDMLRRMPAQPPEQLARFRQRPPWLRPGDYALRCEGLRLVTDETQ